jgi:hypothetical protein
VPSDNILKYGILKCRDLVTLYYGVPMVMSLFESSIQVAAFTPKLLVGQDPRRISYEITLACSDVVTHFAQIGSSLDSLTNSVPPIGAQYQVPPGASIVIERNFLTDGDSICLPVWFQADGMAVLASIRAVFLTPAPIDEVPLG